MHLYLQGEDATTLSLVQRPWFRYARPHTNMDSSRSTTAAQAAGSSSSSSPSSGARSRHGARARNSFSYQPPHKRAPTEKVVTALLNGDLDAHAKNFARHLSGSRGAEDQSQLCLLLDALDVLSSREKPIYCQLVQRLAEELLFECIDYLCSTITGVGRVHLDVKLYNVIRLLWVSCLYAPALHHLAGYFRELLIPYHGILLACCRSLRRSLSTCSDSSTTTSGTYSRDLNSDGDALVSKDSVMGVAICTLSVLYNNLMMVHNRDVMEYCCQMGIFGIIVSLLRRTRQVMVGEACLRILDLACEHGGTMARTLLRDHQVMREAANLWHFMLRHDLVTKSGFQIAELIARLSEYLRHGSKGYAGSSGFAAAAPSQHGSHSKPEKATFLYRCSQIKMVLWCSSPNCALSEESTGQKLKMCARCRLMMYCSQDCQSYHWTNGHRERCGSRNRKSAREQEDVS
ncbi:uncharacterized protein LOC129256488 [Lytechinus pictus]|uniref:uncharacterized protein LOC129256488 n=1 Tax=Lytechinus pictus TaxID=7653 RepID=UPI00240E2FDE|nr:uncharacterized protein LOC129256488 [Lytechinus pictus]